MNKYIKIAVGVALVAGLGVAGVKKIKEARAADASLPKAKIYPIVVKTMVPKEASVKLTLPYLAEVANDKDVKLSARIAARVQSIKPSGLHVTKGEVLVQLDTTNIRSALKSVEQQLAASKIALKNLKATHKRTLELLKVQGASIEESQKESTMIASNEATLNALQQQKIELKNNLSYATIVSPVDGVIAKTYVSRGAISAPGKPLVALSSKNGFYLLVRVPSDVTLQGVEFDGKSYSASALNTTYHSLAEYKVYTGETNLVSGDRVQVDVVTLNQNATLLPFDALLDRDGKSFVLVVEGGKAVPKEVQILRSAQQGVVISQSLEGKEIVLAKQDILLKLLSGYALKVKE